MLDRISPLSPAVITGTCSLALAFLLLFSVPQLAPVPLLLFVLLCFTAPFIPSSSFFLPVISRGGDKVSQVALTFDDGPSPDSTPILLNMLQRYGFTATFFVIGRKAEAYPGLITSILEQGHTIGNHSWRHDNFLMFRSSARLRKDIHDTQALLRQLGVRPRFFRPPAGITGPRLHKVLRHEDLLLVNYSCRAMDRGNRNIVRLADKILSRLRPGDIIMLHDLPPFHGGELDLWQQELEHIFSELKEKYSVAPLAEVICMDVEGESPPVGNEQPENVS